jgi:hypothetical protein
MALQISLSTTPVGIGAPAAYLRVATFRGDKNKIYANVEIYLNADARNSHSTPVAQHEYEMNLLDLRGPILPALYNWLKLKPEFVDAIDC